MKPNPKERVYDLEERLLDFAVRIMTLVEKLPKTRIGNHWLDSYSVAEPRRRRTTPRQKARSRGAILSTK